MVLLILRGNVINYTSCVELNLVHEGADSVFSSKSLIVRWYRQCLSYYNTTIDLSTRNV